MDFAGHSVAPWCEVINPESGFDQQSKFDILGSDRRPVPTKDTRPLHLFFKRSDAKRHLENVLALLPPLERRTLAVGCVSELAKALEIHRPQTICLHCADLDPSSVLGIINMINTMTVMIDPGYHVTVSISITRDVSHRTILELRKSGVSGIIPSYADFGLEECLLGVRAQWAGMVYWPKHILEQLPGHPKKVKSIRIKSPDLTARKQQIFDIITQQGLTNKQIAWLLKISECTVKIHVSDLMRKYGCKNRTQLSVYREKLGH